MTQLHFLSAAEKRKFDLPPVFTHKQRPAYSSAILSSLLARVEKRGDMKAKEILCRVSPVVWQRVNLNGVYEFESDEQIELERLLRDVSTDSSQLFAI
jgi:hypothetical protein